jgi:hypothetical protein
METLRRLVAHASILLCRFSGAFPSTLDAAQKFFQWIFFDIESQDLRSENFFKADL